MCTWASQFLARSGQSNFVVSMYLGLSNCFCEQLVVTFLYSLLLGPPNIFGPLPQLAAKLGSSFYLGIPFFGPKLGVKFFVSFYLGLQKLWPTIGSHICVSFIWASIFVPFIWASVFIAHSWQPNFVFPFTWASCFLWPKVRSEIQCILLFTGVSKQLLPIVGNQFLLCPCTWAFQIGSHVFLFPFTLASKHFLPTVGSQVWVFCFLVRAIFWPKVGGKFLRLLLLGTPRNVGLQLAVKFCVSFCLGLVCLWPIIGNQVLCVLLLGFPISFIPKFSCLKKLRPTIERAKANMRAMASKKNSN